MRHFVSGFSSTLAVAALVTCFVGFSPTLEAGKLSQRPIKKLTYDPDAKKVELFAALEDETIDYTMIMEDSKEGTLFVENKTDEAISVGVPKAIVGVQVLAQFDGLDGGGFGDTGGGDTGGGGQQQAIGGGMGGMGGGMGMGGMGGGMGMGGGGFFSIPPKKLVAVPIRSVCLEHGKKEPTPRADYKLIKPEEYSDNEALHELLALIGTGKINEDVAQAAAWNMSSKMSWRELAMKTENNYGPAGPRRVFSNAHLLAAQNLVNYSVAKAKQEKKDDQPEQPQAPSRVSRVNK